MRKPSKANTRTVVFVTRITHATLERLTEEATLNCRTAAGQARFLLENALGIDRSSPDYGAIDERLD